MVRPTVRATKTTLGIIIPQRNKELRASLGHPATFTPPRMAHTHSTWSQESSPRCFSDTGHYHRHILAAETPQCSRYQEAALLAEYFITH